MANRKIVKQKKINEYASLLLVIVIAVAAMGIIPVLLDENAKTFYAEISESLDVNYQILKEKIEELSKSQKELDKNVAALNGVSVESKDWEGASEKIAEKLEEIAKFEAEYLDSFKNEDLKLTYIDYFNYVKDPKEGKLASEYFALLKKDADLAITRAPSLKALNEIVKKYKSDVEAIFTNVEVLNNIFADIDKDKVIDLKDLDNYKLLRAHFATINPDIYTAEEYATLKTKIDKEMNDVLREVSLNDFVTKANLLPVNPYKLYDLKAVESAQKALALLTDTNYGLYKSEELNDLDANSAYKKALAIYDLASLRAIEVKTMTGDKNTVGTALWINAQFDAKKKEKIDSLEDKVWIEELMAMVEQWEADYSIVTDNSDPNFCQQIYDLVNRAQLKKFIDDYNKYYNSL